MKHILVVDDEVGPRESLRLIFGRQYQVSLAEDAAQARETLSRETVDLMLLDVMMPGKDGIALLREVHGLYPNMPVIMVSAAMSVRPVVEAIREGAYDYIVKPFDVDEIQHLAARAIEGKTLHRKVAALESEIAREFPVEGIVGESSRFRAAMEDVRKAAATDATVLIRGESGTGKELAARLLHALSNRREEPFVAVHCAALPETLMESELFGHEKGAFTGADRMKPGRFDLAGSGTLFFDEVSEMSLAMQVKLLRVLQEREFMRVGGTRLIRTNARIVAATAKDLRSEVREGRFRDDLYYRLGVVPVSLPALREREGDVALLARHFLTYFRQAMDAATEDFSPEAANLMQGYAWPGNVRELRNIVERMLVLHGRERLILPSHLPEEFHARPAGTAAVRTGSFHERVGAYERELIEDALRQCNGVQTRTAQMLGTTRRILRYKMERLGIPVTDPAGAGE